MGRIGRIGRNDDVGAIWKRFADRFKRFAPHDDRVPQGEPFKALEVVGDMPKELATESKPAIFSNRRNNTYAGF